MTLLATQKATPPVHERSATIIFNAAKSSLRPSPRGSLHLSTRHHQPTEKRNSTLPPNPSQLISLTVTVKSDLYMLDAARSLANEDNPAKITRANRTVKRMASCLCNNLP